MNVLFLCTHNSARSILAEALLNHLGQGRFKAYSAGSSPRDKQQPHPLTLETLAQAGISTEGLCSKSWDAFAQPDAPHMDLVITVCDSAAGEVCPFWPGQKGHTSPAALSHTVMTKSILGASGAPNLSQLLLCSPSIETPALLKVSRANGLGF